MEKNISLKKFLNQDDIKVINEKLKGWNTIPENNLTFIEMLNRWIENDKWKIKDLKAVNQLINDGFGSVLDYIFLELNSHETYKKYYGSEKHRDISYSLPEFQEMIKSTQ